MRLLTMKYLQGMTMLECITIGLVVDSVLTLLKSMNEMTHHLRLMLLDGVLRFGTHNMLVKGRHL